MSAARTARSTALTALGKPPVKPFKFEDRSKSDDDDDDDDDDDKKKSDNKKKSDDKK
jgi:hypothetical protein